ncbi:MAG: DALR anticodon-binding domain-containing protein [Patescibacteria group bacterium]
MTFDWDKALSFEGNSGPYIQYAYVRAKKILPADFTPKPSANNLELSPHDKSLIQSLAGFRDAVDTTAKTYKPHHIALYAYSLAVTFNGFYVHTPKILEEKNTELRDFRLALVAKATETLKQSFELLGIEMPSEM